MATNPAHFLRAALIAAIALGCLPLAAQADSTMNAVHKFAHAANAGWINLRPDVPAAPAGIVFGEYFLSGQAYAANLGWIDFGDGAPADGIRYANNSGADCGVNHDGSGNLSGLAYGANVGWINFGWATSSDPDRPRVDLLTGAFTGYAYSANLGWIQLGTGYLTTDTMVSVDSDSDGIADAWERQVFGDLATANAMSNWDGDASSDKEEYLAATLAKDASSHFGILSVIYNSDHTGANVTFTSSPGRLYDLEVSNNLGSAPDMWLDSGLGVITPDTGVSTTRSVSWLGTDRKFVRVVAQRPLQ